MSKVFRYGGIVASIVLIAFGVGAIYTGFDGRDRVQSDLAREQIVGTPDSTIPNQLVDTGSEAQAFAKVMRKHTMEATGGKTYAQMPRYLDANGSPRQGSAVDPVDAIQILTVEATGGSYTITYAPRPMYLTAQQSPAKTGNLVPDDYYYVVTALFAGGLESLPSPEAYATVRTNGSVSLEWYPVPFATGYKVYRGTATGVQDKLVATLGAVTTYTDNLASPAAGFITGTAIPCDGGLLGAALAGLDG